MYSEIKSREEEACCGGDAGVECSEGIRVLQVRVLDVCS